MVEFQDARIAKLVDDNKRLAAEVERLKEALGNSENNVKRVSLLMSELKLSKAI
jgi:regulator of replication initiation timing